MTTRAQRDEVDAWLATHHGVIHRTRLLELGLSPRQADRVVCSARWETLWPGVYRSRAHALTPQSLMVAVCLARPDVSIGFTSAGQEWGIRGMSDPRVHVLLPHPSRLSFPGVVVHRCRQIDPVDLAGRRDDGIRLTSPPRTLLDAASIVGARRTESAVEQVLADNRCTLATLVSTAARLWHPRRPGSGVFRDVLAGRPEWRRAARSGAELDVLRAIEARGLPVPEVNLPLVLPDGSRIEVDLAWPVWKVAYEVDHPFWHDGWAESRRDKRRDRQLGAMGWLPQRLTQADIDEDLPRTLDDIAATLLARGVVVAPGVLALMPPPLGERGHRCGWWGSPWGGGGRGSGGGAVGAGQWGWGMSWAWVGRLIRG